MCIFVVKIFQSLFIQLLYNNTNKQLRRETRGQWQKCYGKAFMGIYYCITIQVHFEIGNFLNFATDANIVVNVYRLVGSFVQYYILNAFYSNCTKLRYICTVIMSACIYVMMTIELNF